MRSIHDFIADIFISVEKWGKLNFMCSFRKLRYIPDRVFPTIIHHNNIGRKCHSEFEPRILYVEHTEVLTMIAI